MIYDGNVVQSTLYHSWSFEHFHWFFCFYFCFSFCFVFSLNCSSHSNEFYAITKKNNIHNEIKIWKKYSILSIIVLLTLRQWFKTQKNPKMEKFPFPFILFYSRKFWCQFRIVYFFFSFPFHHCISSGIYIFP